MDKERELLLESLLSNKYVVETLAKKDKTQFCAELCRKRLISKNVKNTFNLLDQEHIEGWLQVRYLLKFVIQSIKKSANLWGEFLICLKQINAMEVFYYLEIYTSTYNSDNIMNYPLNSNNIAALKEVLDRVKHKWKELGTALGLLNVDQYGDPVHNNVISLINILEGWILKPFNVSTLSKLQDALRQEYVDEGKLANSLEQKFRQSRDTQCTSVGVGSSEEIEIINDSVDTVMADGKFTLLGVFCSYAASVSYQWLRNGQILSNSLSHSGVKDSVLVLQHTDPEIEGWYYKCIITHNGKTLSSNEVKVSVMYSPFKKHIMSRYAKLREVEAGSFLTNTQRYIDINIQECNYCSEFQAEKRSQPEEDTDFEKEVKYNEVFNNYKEGDLIFVKGRPGSGKTTLMKKITKDWAAGRALRDSKIVFYISLRNCEVSKSKKLSDLLRCCYSFNAEEIGKTVEEIKKCDGKGFCFIFDGLNEICLDKSSCIFNIINKCYLCSAEVIVSSRPEGFPIVQCNISRIIETAGFTKESLFTFIDTYCDANAGKKVKKYFESLIKIPRMYYLPFNACIICYIYKRSYSQQKIPDTETQLHKEAITLIFKHYFNYRGIELKFHSFDDLKEVPSFKRLCKLAYCMLNTQTDEVFVKHLRDWNIEVFENGDVDLWSLEILEVKNAELQEEKALSFIHANFQEFLAANYIVNISREEKLIEFEEQIKRQVYYIENKHQENYKEDLGVPTKVWSFYCGLETFKFDGDFKLFSRIISFSSNKLEFAFETSQDEVCYRIIHMFEKEYCSDEDNGGITLEHFSNTVTKTEETDVCVTIGSEKTLDMYFQIVSDEILHKMKGLCTKEFQDSRAIPNFTSNLQYCASLEVLDLKLIHLSCDASNLIAEKVRSLTNLKKLTLHCKPGEGDGIPLLLDRLQDLGTSIHFTFEELHKNLVSEVSNMFNQFGSSQISVLQLSRCAFNSHLSERFAHGVSQLVCLKTLNLSHNNIIASEISHIATAMQHLRNLERLDLSHNHINARGAQNLSSAFEHLKKLKHLSLSDNNIGPSGVDYLAMKICYLINLISIDISNNCINMSAAKNIIMELLRCRKFKKANIGLEPSILNDVKPNTDCSILIILIILVSFLILVFLLGFGFILKYDEPDL